MEKQQRGGGALPEGGTWASACVLAPLGQQLWEVLDRAGWHSLQKEQARRSGNAKLLGSRSSQVNLSML